MIYRTSLSLLSLTAALACSSIEGTSKNMNTSGNSTGDTSDTDEGSTGDATTGGDNTGSGGTFAQGTGGNMVGMGAGGTPLGGDGDASGGAQGGDGDGTGGGEDGGGGPKMSAGCGAGDHPTTSRYTIEVNGKMREYELDVPDDYDSSKPYPLIFGLHWRGGNSRDVLNNGYYGLKARANGGMIFASPEGLVPGGTSGWANEGGEDVELIEKMLDRFEEELCIDTAHVFATGFSFGGMFSNAIGCALADRFTAVAPYAGSLWSGCESSSTPIAYLGTHGVQDSVVSIDAGREARDEFLSRNGCSSDSSPLGSNGCMEYSGCTKPLVWCEYSGDHGWPMFSDEEVWDFFSRF